MTARIMLEARLDTSAASKLLAQIDASECKELILDASKVQMLGGLCLEAILTAKQRCVQTGIRFQVEDASDVFENDLACLGLQLGDLDAEVLTE